MEGKEISVEEQRVIQEIDAIVISDVGATLRQIAIQMPSK